MHILCHVQAAGLDPEHIRYRETWMSPAATSGMSEDQVKERIHAVMKGLEPSFDLPDTAEGIETLTHVRTPEDLVPVLAWLGNAKQYAARPQPGWSTPAPPNARAAAEAWQRVRQACVYIVLMHACASMSHPCPACSAAAANGMPNLLRVLEVGLALVQICLHVTIAQHAGAHQTGCQCATRAATCADCACTGCKRHFSSAT